MKKYAAVLIFVCLHLHAIAQLPAGIANDPRIVKVINSNWTFNYFPDEKAGTGYEAPGFDDSRWPAVSVPHTWMTYETTGELHPFIRNAAETDNSYWWEGWGWYRKHFTISSTYSAKKVFVEFEGVQKYCKVWINGKYLGDHKGGYGSFDFDLTPHLNPGKDNVLVVAVNNKRNDQYRIPPMTAGNFNVYGGIYRDVSIVIKDKLHIPMQGSASHEGGTFITTPGVTEKEALVRIQTWVKNDNNQSRSCLLNTYIVDASGKVIQTIRSKASVGAGQYYKFDQLSKPVKNPNLWSPENPYLYKVYTQISDGSKVTDSYTSPLGFRWFRWDYKENFLYINGKKTVLHGGNRHQEYPWLGDAIPKWITEMDFRDITENLNYNFMRTSHYPNDKMVYDIADREGIVIIEESPSIKNFDFSAEVQEIQMKEMIRRDRNHPSIMFWSMGNETNRAVDSKFAVAEDTTRIITARRVSGNSAGAFVKHNDENLPIENLLRCTVRGWYNKDVKNLEPSDPQHSGTEEHHVNMLISSGLVGRGNLSTWLYADHGADREYVNAPLLHLNPKGYVDLYRIPKYAYYFWQAAYYEKPMVFIQPHYWREEYLGQKKDLTVYSNCEKVELRVNGSVKGVQVPSAENFHTVVFRDITIEKGTVTAVATRGNSSVTTQVVMAGQPAKIVLSASHQQFTADKSSVVIIKADITDQQGSHVYGATNPLRWSVSGPATLVGPSAWEPDNMKDQFMEGTWYIDAPVANVIRSSGVPGKIRVTVSASGLASGSVELTATELKPDNSIISEQVLKDEGRRTVTRISISMERLDDIPQEIKRTTGELNLNAAGKAGFKSIIRETLYKNNPGTDTTSVEFRSLAELFATHLVNNNGHLSADDHNFNIDHYNNARLIAGYVNATKLPPLFKEALREYYSDAIIIKGIEKNAGDEMNWMNWIPSGGTVIVSNDGQGKTWPKGVIVTDKTDLADLIAAVYPQFTKYSDEARTRALVFVGKMNPYVSAETAGPQDGKAAKTIYTAQKGKLILIPLIKFISE
jgi:hypothetical protein